MKTHRVTELRSTEFYLKLYKLARDVLDTVISSPYKVLAPSCFGYGYGGFLVFFFSFLFFLFIVCFLFYFFCFPSPSYIRHLKKYLANAEVELKFYTLS